MTMYLPNGDVHPTGQEPAEFVDASSGGAPGDLRRDDAPAIDDLPLHPDLSLYPDVIENRETEVP